MFTKLADNRDQNSMASQMRRKRFAFFNSLLSKRKRPVRILDIGGTEEYWKMMPYEVDDRVSITLLNLDRAEVTMPNMTSIAGDARSVQMEDKSFDVVFSNSVIEHVGDYRDQAKMTKEVVRVGKCYFIQTPNRYFPMEPHFVFPLFQFLPLAIRTWLLQSFRLGWFPKTPDKQKAREIVESIRLLDKAEFSALFPDARIYEEKVFGLTKSFVAYAGWDESQ
jgi:ubiquinone/menaquinone biosynthesis C-methylase UbiE